MGIGIVTLNIKCKNGCILMYPFLLVILLHVHFIPADKQNNQTT
jgi:hypothetical protein